MFLSVVAVDNVASVDDVSKVAIASCSRDEGALEMVQTQRLFELESLFFLGDNLEMLRRFVPDDSVDLVYLDPPFKSNASYNIFRRPDGSPASAQIHAFVDTWTWGLESERAFKEVLEMGGSLSRALKSFRELLDTNDMLAYLAMMAPRLVELRRVLRASGTLYLHCDSTAVHYLKVLLDAVFRPENMLSEIIWKRTGTHSSAKRWGPVHDTILVYAKKRGEQTWNKPFEPLSDGHRKRHYRHQASDGRAFTHGELTAPGIRRGRSGLAWRGFDVAAIGRHWSTTVDKLDTLDAAGEIYWPRDGGWPRRIRFEEPAGRAMGDVWTDIAPLNMKARERIGYPTQKPIALLERIIQASSNEGDTVLDPFCGCGTAVDAAQKLGRRWIGIDIAKVALEVIEQRLASNHPEVRYTVRVIPTTMDEVEILAARDKYGYQQWVCDMLGIRAEVRKGADRGIDGELVRYESESGNTVRTVVSVKGGGVSVGQVRDLRGTLERERAQAAIFVSHKPPTSAMKTEALAAGLTDGGIPRIQLLTSQDLIDGVLPKLPVPVRVGQLAFSTDSEPAQRRFAVPTK